MSAPLRVTGRRCWPLAAALLMLAGCKAAEEPALGTLEWDRITVPAPAMERIVAVRVHEGQRVSAGTSLLQLEPARTAAQLQSLQAQAERAQQALQELRNGARPESIAQARANLAAARAQAASASAYYARLEPLGRRQLVAAADVDSARAAAGNAQGQMRAAEQALLVLEHGTRAEELAQGESALQAAQAQVAGQTVAMQQLELLAPRDGLVDALPYRLGDQAPVGAPLVVLLVGERPYARVYLPQSLRLKVSVGQAARIHLQERTGSLSGRIRSIRSEPGFTPYYALSGADVSRLSWLAEIELTADNDTDAMARLPAGVPVQVVF